MKFRIPLLLIVFVVQLLVPAWSIYDLENTRSQGQEFRFRAEPVDPYDAFRGKYVRIGFTDTTAPYHGEIDPKRGDSVFAYIQVDDKGISTISEIAHQAPQDSTPYIKVKFLWVTYEANESGNAPINPQDVSERNRVANFAFPMDRFYMEETIAPAAEKAYRDARGNSDLETTVTVRILNGKAVLTGLYINDQPMADYVRSLALNAQ